MNNFAESHHFDCDCSSEEHIFRVTSENGWDNDYPPEIHISIQLNQYRNLFKRFVTALRYFFGYECKFGHWDVVTLKHDDINRLVVLLHQHRIKVEKFLIEKEKNGKST
jgi:hypothetical protein